MSSSDDVPTTPRQARDSHLESLFWRRVLVNGIRLLPRWLQRASMPAWAGFFYVQVPHVRRAILSNLGQLSCIADGAPSSRWQRERLAFRTFYRYCDSVARAYMFYLSGRCDRGGNRGDAKLREVAAEGRGAILVTGHIGCWQQGAALLRRDGFPPVTLVMAEEPNAATQRLENHLRDDKLSVLYPTRSPLSLLSLRSVLSRGELVAMQLDRPVSGGIVAPFFGGTATFAAGPALLSRTCQVPVVPVFFPLRDDEIAIEVEDPMICDRTADRDADLQRFTARLAAIYERHVLADLDQWYNFFSFWHR